MANFVEFWKMETIQYIPGPVSQESVSGSVQVVVCLSGVWIVGACERNVGEDWRYGKVDPALHLHCEGSPVNSALASGRLEGSVTVKSTRECK